MLCFRGGVFTVGLELVGRLFVGYRSAVNKNGAVCVIYLPVISHRCVCPGNNLALLNGCPGDFSCRYSIAKSSDATKAFKIDSNNGTVTVAKPLDRETSNWHNVTVVAKETSKANFLSYVKAPFSHVHGLKKHVCSHT